MRCAMSSMTGLPVQMLTPKSPCAMLPSQRRYWLSQGSLRPSFSRSCCTCASLASPLTPSITCAASPGIKRIIKNTSTETPSNTLSRSSRRLKISSRMGRRPIYTDGAGPHGHRQQPAGRYLSSVVCRRYTSERVLRGWKSFTLARIAVNRSPLARKAMGPWQASVFCTSS